jgi:hypothetical protein
MGLKIQGLLQMRLEMTKTNRFSRIPNENPKRTLTQQVAGGIAVATLLLITGIASAQTATADVPQTPQPTVQNGFAIHQTVDLGGHVVGIFGSTAMYDTLVNLHSGPRVLGETYTMHAAPGSKHSYLDSLTAFSTGFGGDPYNYAKLDFSKGKTYEFNGMFRRDRQYFDYDLFGNPNIPGGQSIPIGVGGALGHYAWPQVNQSPELFNTVRRMTDTNLTIFPLSKVTFHLGYAQNIFQGPRLIPGAYETTSTPLLFQEMERNSTDDFLGAVDWKPLQQTIITFEEEVTHYKNDSYFTIAPNQFTFQEADGTPVTVGDWDSQFPFGSAVVGAATGPAAACNTTSMATPGVILTSASGTAGLPVIDPACNVVSKYTRYQPTRIIYPTEVFRFSSASIRNVAANGSFRYTKANSNLPDYYENFQGLKTAIRSATYTGVATARREDVGADFGATWQVASRFSIADQVNFSNVRIPGTGTFSGVTESIPAAAITAHNETINYAGPLTPGVVAIVGQAPNGLPLPNYLGERDWTNNATATWDATSRTTLSLTYRYRTRFIGEKVAAYSTATPPVLSNPVTDVNITENGGIFNVALRPTEHWDVNGTVEALYDDNAFTPVGPRQTRHYRIHTLYRPKTWATVSGAFNDLERHNNTNNITSITDPTVHDALAGPLQHVDHSRVGSVGLVLSPSEHYGLDINYAYSDVYASTNICYLNGATATLPGTAVLGPGGAPAICPGVFVRGSTTVLSSWGPTKDFMDAPTQYASVGLNLSPSKSIHSTLGYRISSVSGNQFFNDARQVNGSLQSAYQSPYVHFAWTVHPGWVWKADYDFYGYGEGGPSGAPLCSTTTSTTATVVPCNSPTLAAYPTGLTEPSSGLTAPRNFHASVLTLAMHYEF